MGIPYFYYYLYRKYHKETKLVINESDVVNLKLDHVFLDYNSMIHPCAHQALSLMDPAACGDVEEVECRIVENCMAYTRYVVDLLQPKNVHVMIDGVAPRAKINQQRERRYKSEFLKPVYSREGGEKKVEWDSNKITPGTAFMDKIAKELHRLQEIMQDTCTMHISDSNQVGEGEHKMMNYISDCVREEDTICIYGLDADLIMLSLLNARSDNIVLLRDNTFNTKLNEDQRTFTYLDIQKLKRAIYDEIDGQSGGYVSGQGMSQSSVLVDYAFLCFLLGNDFVEHVPSLIIKENGVNLLIKYYVQVLQNRGYKTLVDAAKVRENLAGSIDIAFLTDILYNMSKAEEYFFQRVYSVYKTGKPVYRDTIKMEDVELLCADVSMYAEDYVKYNVPGFKKRHYIYYGIENPASCCYDYLEGLYWILGYYFGHCHNNWSWYYKHHGVPFASDLYKYLSVNQTTFQHGLVQSTAMQASPPNNVLEQLMMVLPRRSLLGIMKGVDMTLHGRLERFFRTDSCDLQRFYPERICIDLVNKEYLWQSKVFFEIYDKQILNILL